MDTPESKLITMQVQGLIVDPITEAPIVVLREPDGHRFLPIWIGSSEARAIAITLEGLELPRPLTHDLFMNTLEAFEANVSRVEIHTLKDGTFYARLILLRSGEEIEIDARPSDAMALALRADAPIMVAASVLEAAKGDESPVDEDTIKDILQSLDEDDLGDYTM